MINCYCIKIKNINTQKHINNLIKKFEIYNIQTDENYVSFCFKKAHYKQIINYLKNSNIEIFYIEKIGRFSKLLRIEKIGILIGFFVGIVLWVISTFFVTKIVVYGNSIYSVDDITKIVTNLYSTNIISKTKVNTTEIEQEIVAKTAINTVSCILKGNCLVISVKEELRTDTYVEGQFSPLLSVYDGQVTSINIIQGTPAVSVGQIIKLGDVLVYPYVLDSSGEKRFMQPIADIVCDVWITAKIDVYDTQVITQKTGNKQQIQNIYAFGQPIYVSNRKIKFEQYEKSSKIKYLTNFLIPIKLETIVYEETKKITKNIDFEKEKQNYINKCRQIAFLGVQEYDIIKDERHTILSNNGKHTITYVLTIGKKIC